MTPSESFWTSHATETKTTLGVQRLLFPKPFATLLPNSLSGPDRICIRGAARLPLKPCGITTKYLARLALAVE